MACTSLLSLTLVSAFLVAATTESANVQVSSSDCVGCNDPLLYKKLVEIVPSHLKNVTKVERVSTQVVNGNTRYTVKFVADNDKFCNVFWDELAGGGKELGDVTCVA